MKQKIDNRKKTIEPTAGSLKRAIKLINLQLVWSKKYKTYIVNRSNEKGITKKF